ncbi:MAG: hypothetical protein KDC98_19800, partial [Planctomycetes bacterium]|nr:hypothetical protein [Planctomycetota bacterium]
MTHIASLSVLLFSPALLAQLAPGDIGVTGFSSSDFGVISSGTTTGYSTPGYGGSGTSQAILWDPSAPQSFLIGGFGFVGRATVTGPGAVSYTNLTTAIGTACQISFDFAGDVVIADAGVDQVRILNITTNTVTDLTTGAQPWGTTVNAGAFNPTNGDII